MSGKGKYTQYSAPASDKNTLLSKLFSKNAPASALPPQMKEGPGKEAEVMADVIQIAKSVLTPANQTGDLGFFPNGVKLNFGDSPKTDDVKWTHPGDPENAYTPDITSPGPGKTSGLDKDTDPGINVSDLKPAYVPKGPDTGTKSPADTSGKVVDANTLGANGKLGSSDGAA